MGRYLNPDGNSFVSSKRFSLYVDKSLLIKETNACFGIDETKFMCVTRPRRFGKTMALSMLNAYYSKGCDSRKLFENLKISKDPSFEEHLNKHNVLWVDLGSVFTGLKDPNLFVDEIQRRLLSELAKSYPNVNLEGLSLSDAIVELYLKKGDRFVFLIDEWDAVYREQSHNRKVCDEFTKFLRELFKSTDVSKCFDLVYMTGILPIRRYNTQSALNMFTEYNMLKPGKLASFFGFTESETKALCQSHGMDFAEIRSWYDGYRPNQGKALLGGLEPLQRQGAPRGHHLRPEDPEAQLQGQVDQCGLSRGEERGLNVPSSHVTSILKSPKRLLGAKWVQLKRKPCLIRCPPL